MKSSATSADRSPPERRITSSIILEDKSVVRSAGEEMVVVTWSLLGVVVARERGVSKKKNNGMGHSGSTISWRLSPRFL